MYCQEDWVRGSPKSETLSYKKAIYYIVKINMWINNYSKIGGQGLK
jgi:hypothetical protein